MEKKSGVDFRFGKVIGEGSFSTVYLAKEIASGKEYAVKVCDKSTIIKENKQEYIKREKSALHILNSSPGIISLACTFQDRTKLFFVLTYAANGELLKYINRSESLKPECVKFYSGEFQALASHLEHRRSYLPIILSAELLLAIEEMHKKNIIHRDLKPENLLLSRDMHLMVADFGSSKILSEDYDAELVQEEIDRYRAEISNDSDCDSPSEKPSNTGRKRASFVGTAQYVSPELLKGNASHLSTDLWALGCIIYQMISGIPPFRGATEYLIFQKILNVEYDFPDNFDSRAKDLVSKLLCFDPKDRLGSQDSNETRYQSIRNHSFFDDIDWNENLYQLTPPEMQLPQSFHDDESKQNEYSIGDDIEPGLGERQLRRILQMEFGALESAQSESSSASLERMLEEQRTNNEWSGFVESDELIIKYGLVNKRKKGLFTRRRMLLLTSKPRLIYIDPMSKIKKGEIPFDASLTCDPKNFKLFDLHTPNRTYYLEETDGDSLVWCDAIMKAKEKFLNTEE